jgi:SHS2 domain-containing protein
VSGAGHRALPHTADVRVEAWAPSREGCVAEAVAGMVAGFADLSAAAPIETVTRRIDRSIDRAADDDLLVGVLEEVIYLLDTRGLLPVATDVVADGGGLVVRFDMADADQVPPIGAVPKAVSLHDLRFERRDGGWWCAVTLDV